MLIPGLKHTSAVQVGVDNTAMAMGSGNMDVFATPSMVALMENAAMNAVAEHLPEGSTTVGSLIETTHVRPSGLGATVSAEAELLEVDNRKLTFKVVATDEKGVIGEGLHIRFVVDKEKFLAKL